MVPWQVAFGLTLAAAGTAAILLGGRLEFLRPYAEQFLADHFWTAVPPFLTALAAFFSVIHWAARKAGLGDLGRKVEHIDRGLLAPEPRAHDRELAEALRRDRAAEWGPRGARS